MTESSELFRSAETAYFDLDKAMLRHSRPMVDGHYLYIPTDSYGVAKITDYMGYSHYDYRQDDQLGSLKRILAAGTPAISIDFSHDSSFYYLAMDPYFLRAHSIGQKFIDFARRHDQAFRPPQPGAGIASAVFFSVEYQNTTTRLINPYLDPRMRELFQKLGIAAKGQLAA